MEVLGRPVLQDLFPVARKECVHISGLEVEGLHPRVLMECALVWLIVDAWH